MPELPDVTVYVEALRSRIVGQVVREVKIASPFVLRSVDPPISAAAGRTVTGIERLGKRIVIGLDGDLWIVIHLMIAGRFRWLAPDKRPPGKLGLAGFIFETGALWLTEAGTKRRASLHLVAGRASLVQFERGGLEPLEMTPEQFAARLKSENHTLKRSLTDPRLFSGIGNSYSDEILHRAQLSPLTLTRKLGDTEIAQLFEATRDVLNEWTVRLRAEAGSGFPEKVTAFRPGMAVHGRYGEPCPVCGSPVQRIVYAENECNYCARCQTRGVILADRALSRLLHDSFPRSLDEG